MNTSGPINSLLTISPAPPRPEVNESDIAKSLDIVAVNPYHATQDQFDGESA